MKIEEIKVVCDKEFDSEIFEEILKESIEEFLEKIKVNNEDYTNAMKFLMNKQL